jgi:hypothetical protein
LRGPRRFVNDLPPVTGIVASRAASSASATFMIGSAGPNVSLRMQRIV